MSSLQQPLQQQQPQQEQPQQQPVLVYPNNVRNQPSTSHHSNGSFGSVFIVLAVIIVISAIACFLGRLCNRRSSNSKPSKQAVSHNLRPKKEGAGNHHHQMEFGDSNSSFRPRDPDIEIGFDKKIPSGGKPKGKIGIVGNGSRPEGRGHMNPNKPHNGNGDHHHMNGEMKQPAGDHAGFGEPIFSG